MRRYVLLPLLLMLLSACAPAHARPWVQMDLIDRDTGQWLPTYPHQGERWVAGTPGHRYAVRLTNTSAERVLVVLSVDGVNAVTGQTASPSQAGYVLGPWETTEITGWRKSLRDVAQFHFTDHYDSYASRTDRPQNVGVIGIAVHTERMRYPQYPRQRIAEAPAPASPVSPPYATRSESRPQAAGNASSVASAPVQQEQSIGTGHGGREYAPVSQTSFVRSERPVQVDQLRYDRWDRLVSRGVVPRERDYRRPSSPQAFPQGFVADPPRWR